MMTADHFEIFLSTERIVKMHCASTGHHEDMADAVRCQCLGYVVSDSQC
jgi:hypothetical protein